MHVDLILPLYYTLIQNVTYKNAQSSCLWECQFLVFLLKNHSDGRGGEMKEYRMGEGLQILHMKLKKKKKYRNYLLEVGLTYKKSKTGTCWNLHN